MTHNNSRESWLLEAVEIIRPWFADVEKPLPEKVRVGVGWPKGRRTIGACHSPESADDGVSQIYISPTIAEEIQVLATLVHELVHAADGCQNGHRAEFGRVARALGLTGKLTATVPGDDLTGRLQDVAGKIGEYPHSVLTPATPKQSTRMLKSLCEDCGYTIRLTMKWASQGLPTCYCGGEMVLA